MDGPPALFPSSINFGNCQIDKYYVREQSSRRIEAIDFELVFAPRRYLSFGGALRESRRDAGVQFHRGGRWITNREPTDDNEAH